jgi:hypothetical protein
MNKQEKKDLLRLEAEQLRFKIVLNHARQKKLKSKSPVGMTELSSLLDKWPYITLGWRFLRRPKKAIGKLGMLSGLYALFRFLKP